MSDERLSRTEIKLNKLSKAVVEIARMEERLLTIFKRLENMDAAFKKYDDDVDEIERQALIRGQKIAFAERLFRMFVTGAVGLAFVFCGSMTKTLTSKQADFLEPLFGEACGNIRAAMDLAGYSRTTKTAEVVGPLKEEITERAGMMLAMNAPKTAFGIVDLLDDQSVMGAHNAMFAAREVLDWTELVKKEQVEVAANTSGMFILPPKT